MDKSLKRKAGDPTGDVEREVGYTMVVCFIKMEGQKKWQRQFNETRI
jgi:hypothetical protein